MAANKNSNAMSDVYTAMLALASGVVLATAIFVAFQCYSQYETVFKIVGP